MKKICLVMLTVASTSLFAASSSSTAGGSGRFDALSNLHVCNVKKGSVPAQVGAGIGFVAVTALLKNLHVKGKVRKYTSDKVGTADSKKRYIAEKLVDASVDTTAVLAATKLVSAHRGVNLTLGGATKMYVGALASGVVVDGAEKLAKKADIMKYVEGETYENAVRPGLQYAAMLGLEFCVKFAKNLF